MSSTVLGLIPARSGSKRLPNKNVRLLAGHPLMAYSIASALESGVFAHVVVSTDSPKYEEIARHYGAEVLMRPPEYATDTSPDVEWVRHALSMSKYKSEVFAILRPTSPFRQASTIRRAMAEFYAGDIVHSLRAVEKCHEHPAKMWTIRTGYLHPLMPLIEGANGIPGHSSQYPSLPAVYVQNASLEVAWARVVDQFGSIAGECVKPFLTYDAEGFDVNNEYDFRIAELMVERGEVTLPNVAAPVFAGA